MPVQTQQKIEDAAAANTFDQVASTQRNQQKYLLTCLAYLTTCRHRLWPTKLLAAFKCPALMYLCITMHRFIYLVFSFKRVCSLIEFLRFLTLNSLLCP